MFLIAYAFKGQVHVFAGREKIESHLSSRTSAILKYFCPLIWFCFVNSFLLETTCRQTAGNFYKHFGPRSGLTKTFDMILVLKER